MEPIKTYNQVEDPNYSPELFGLQLVYYPVLIVVILITLGVLWFVDVSNLMKVIIAVGIGGLVYTILSGLSNIFPAHLLFRSLMRQRQKNTPYSLSLKQDIFKEIQEAHKKSDQS